MWVSLLSIPDKFVTPIISATAVIAGSLIGAVCSWITTSHSIKKSTEVENKIVEDNRKYDNLEKVGKVCENINIIRLDICTAIFQGIRNLKNFTMDNYTNRYPIPINKDYSRVVASLTSKFDLKEMSYIYQLYGIIETLNKHTNELRFNDKKGYNLIRMDCELLLKKLYGENYLQAIELDIDNIKYEDLYSNDIIKIGYRRVLEKLDNNSCIEKYNSNNN